MTKLRSNHWPHKTAEEDMEDKQETSASLNAVKVISVDAALAPPLSELTQTFHVENIYLFFYFTPG